MRYFRTDRIIVKNRWLLISVLMLGVLFYLASYYQLRKSKGEYVAKKIEKVFIKTQEKFSQSIDVISSLTLNLQPAELFNNEWLRKTPDDLGFVVLIKEKDSLIYWNNNFVGVPQFVTTPEHPIDTVLLLNNGYYQTRVSHSGDYDVYLLSLIYSVFAYENSYLENVFSEKFGAESGRFRFLPATMGDFVIHNNAGLPVFSIEEDFDKPATVVSYIILLILLIIWISIINVYFINVVQQWFDKNKGAIYIAIITVGLVFIRIFPVIFNAFPVLFSSDLFKIGFISFGFLFPSVGDLILNMQLGLFITIVIVKNVDSKTEHLVKNLHVLAFFLISGIIACLYLNLIFVEQVLFHSSIALTINSLYNFNLLSYFLLIVLVLISISFFLVIYRFSKLLFGLSISKNVLFGIYITEVALTQYLMSQIVEFDYLPSIVLVGYFILIFLYRARPTNQNRFVFFILTMVLFSGLLTTMYYRLSQHKSDSEQKLTAFKLGLEKDPMFEFLYADIAEKISNDTLLQRIVHSNDSTNENVDQMVYNYMKDKYLMGYIERYNTEITVCNQLENLNIQPENYVINCNKYFADIIENTGTPTEFPSLFYIEDNAQGTYYISKLTIPQKFESGESATIFLEFYFKYIPEGLGYPELLVDERKGFSVDFTNISFAKYQGDILVYKFGDFLYPARLNDFGSTRLGFTEKTDYRHYTYTIDADRTLIVSKTMISLSERIALFSLFFLLLLIFSVAIYVCFFMKSGELRRAINFRLKLQIFIFAALTFSFSIIGTTSIAYIRGVYLQKNDSFLNERTQSILIELQQKLKNVSIDNEEIQEYLHQLLIKFSLIFFSDINLYALDGHLLGSSRPEIFANGLVSRNMNQEAYRMMRFKRSLFYLQQESIGKGTYYSSYIPFRDANGNPSAYVNLPYFARETELRDEISGFVLAYMNIFLALTAISVVFALILSRRLTKPLMMIQDKMKTVRIDKVNEKIQWNSKDELGQLVSQYNQLIDELALSAGLLARSERETAWREMAQQVAHEIKNPLTPMRLSVQYLKRSWDEKDPDIDDKLNRTTRTLIEQIDTLSEIASAFSDFAKMPVNKPERIDLFVVLQNVVTLFESEAHIGIKLINKTSGETHVFADTKNLNRAFNNLIKNSIQAVGNKPDGFVEVTLDLFKNYYRISVHDNGVGMTEEEKNKIFTPNFTTKSSGMGIGLSIVHNSISAAKGSISFESGKGEGTTFTILLPIVK